MRKALDYFLKYHNITDSIELLETNIKDAYDENIVIHHKQDLSVLHAIREKDIDNDKDFVIQFLLSKEMSRSYRVKEKFCEAGNQVGADLVNFDINMMYALMIDEFRWFGLRDTDITPEYRNIHPERIERERVRREAGIIPQRNPKDVHQIQDLI